MSEQDLSNSDYYLNRELSELAFQERVLREGMDARNPPLERLRFLAFFTKNTDEFFMKRVGGLKQQIDAGVTETTPDGRTPEQQWREVLDTARPLFREQSEYWQQTLKPTLAEEGIDIREPSELSADQYEELRIYYEESILPTLTPLAFDPAHPFPFISPEQTPRNVQRTGIGSSLRASSYPASYSNENHYSSKGRNPEQSPA